MKRSFYVKALWDDEANVWYSETDIIGLHINSKDLEEFEEVVNEFAGELILENHWRKDGIPADMIASTVPIILWQRPVENRQAA